MLFDERTDKIIDSFSRIKFKAKFNLWQLAGKWKALGIPACVVSETLEACRPYIKDIEKPWAYIDRVFKVKLRNHNEKKFVEEDHKVDEMFDKILKGIERLHGKNSGA